MKGQRMVENYMNGNIADARKNAKSLSHREIRDAFMDMAGFSVEKAILTADFLMTGRGWQAACDAD